MSPLRILLVDDDIDFLEVLGSLLEVEGFIVRSETLGSEAIEAAQIFRPHVALIDLGLRDMGGLELGRCLRALPGSGSMALVAVTGNAADSARAAAQAAGFGAYLLKPFEVAEVLMAVNAHR